MGPPSNKRIRLSTKKKKTKSAMPYVKLDSLVIDQEVSFLNRLGRVVNASRRTKGLHSESNKHKTKSTPSKGSLQTTKGSKSKSPLNPTSLSNRSLLDDDMHVLMGTKQVLRAIESKAPVLVCLCKHSTSYRTQLLVQSLCVAQGVPCIGLGRAPEQLGDLLGIRSAVCVAFVGATKDTTLPVCGLVHSALISLHKKQEK